MTDQREPWAERTVEMPPEGQNPFRSGRAQVGPARRAEPTGPHIPTGTGWPGETGSIPRPVFSEELRLFRRGARLMLTGALFAFVCWGLWAISDGGNLGTPFALFVLTGLVALGLYALARVVGRVVWEKQLGRVRRSARGAHLVTAVFLAGVGIAYLRQIDWVVSAWSWFAGLF
ncbi:hypothetical protein Ais01nite_68340 [Asanoa ishikariensis]|uniref:Uncharacterized protein n=1 Tax=Asanoa ishikariensis TaxID=137265 RepID=A0A1H3N826_9ACTN|nr:hypothetical protein [Asanoa ishikariensis]GIF68799.1 hypothetical protein Ais01nite_68340 [Asanoa ishikariensis]SDY84978.1 hypothetical protein SAMN05421684_1896 [Asanoa ishikariensis]